MIRRRARTEGRSVEGYMRERVIEIASRPTKAEVAKSLGSTLEDVGMTEAASIVADVDAERR